MNDESARTPSGGGGPDAPAGDHTPGIVFSEREKFEIMQECKREAAHRDHAVPRVPFVDDHDHRPPGETRP